MQKPSNWDSASATKNGQQYPKPEAGSYVLKILGAKEQMTKGNDKFPPRPMLVLALDIAEGEFSGHFKNMFEHMKTKYPDCKWPLLHRRVLSDDQASRLKGDIKSIEESNPGFKFDFNENNLVGKKVGAMLIDKVLDSGKFILEVSFLCSIETALSGDLKVPKQKEILTSHTSAFTNISIQDDSLPF